MRCCSPTSLRRSRRSPFSTRLQLVLHQTSSDRIQSNWRNTAIDSLSGCATRPLSTRKLSSVSPSPHWRTWIAYSRSERRTPLPVGTPPSSTNTWTRMTIPKPSRVVSSGSDHNQNATRPLCVLEGHGALRATRQLSPRGLHHESSISRRVQTLL